ncbi:FG-GAP repeat domain-containing protein [Tunicatimonas pelagia]|uniref:FG-GAP repeat domain-containing protein n=1 Tax=Tunicatimonas pelagia TaxID=931531 RepID=UPI0026661F16|nr:VCBS repeat-containing protein [Tunicatimonas pelagia]WKN45570.1 VCBS repeat-containing protein [Tunicatimonas pelagia]
MAAYQLPCKLFVTLFFGWLLFSCQSPTEVLEPANIDTLSVGYTLSQQYCGNCHQYPEPGLLPKPIWQKYVLPRMGYRSGIYEHDSVRQSLLEAGLGGARVDQARIYPTQPIINQDQWQAIQDYYLDQAPDSLSVAKPEISVGLPDFRVQIPSYRLSPPSTTMVKIHRQQLLVGDANSKSLYQFDDNLNLQRVARTGEGAVYTEVSPEQFLITVMGSFSPTDNPQGKVITLPRTGEGAPFVLLDSLQRPVQTTVADLDQNGLPDLLTCEFGKWLGGLFYYQQQLDGSFQKVTLRQQPGAIAAYVQDINQDGKPDVLALFGQGDEGIFAYINQGEGKFREETILQFPPSYGSSSMLLMDIDKDGDKDIVYTAGDNADYPPILKPYHGIYFFSNDGNYQFKQSWFYPLPGAYRALPADYDQDGDLDIAAISFFPNYQLAPESGFVYLQNEGEMNFSAHTFTESTYGRWLVADTGDLDGDGDLDIALGSLAFEVVPPNGLLAKWVEQGIPFVVLENQIKVK